MTEKILMTSKEFSVVQRKLIADEIYFIGGGQSIYVPSLKTKYMIDDACRLWPNLDQQPEYMTPGEAARTELVRFYGYIKRVGWPAKHVALFDLRPPLHYGGPAAGLMTYVDLDAAYYNIYRYLWLDTPYPRGFGTMPLFVIANNLQLWKTARNSLMGVIRSRGAVGVRGRKRFNLRTRNRFLSPGLWATVQEQLHMVASKALELGALYINTDGYLFMGQVPDEFWEFCIDHSLSLSIRAEGFGVIKGWNSYKIGDKSTAVYKAGLNSNTKEFSNVSSNNRRKNSAYRRRIVDCFKRGAYPRRSHRGG